MALVMGRLDRKKRRLGNILGARSVGRDCGRDRGDVHPPGQFTGRMAYYRPRLPWPAIKTDRPTGNIIVAIPEARICAVRPDQSR